MGEGDTYEDAVADATSAIEFHIETFGTEALEIEDPCLRRFHNGNRDCCLMHHFPVDVPKTKAIKTLEKLGFRVVRVLTIPNYRRIKGATLRRICTQSGISRADFLEAYEHA